MAAGTVTVVQAEDLLRLALKDREDEFMDAEEYRTLVLDHAGRAQDYDCELLTAHTWRYGGGRLCLTGVSATVPGFTVADNLAYLVRAGSMDPLRGTLSITASGLGSDATDPLRVRGCPVNFAAVLEAALVFIATHRAQEYAMAMNGGSISLDQTRAELLRQASIIAGVKAL